MNDLQKVFSYQENQVRTVVKDGEIWFVAKDVCDPLELENVSSAVGRLDEDEKGIISINTLGGPQEMLCVNEPGIYNLILGSRGRKSEIKAFKRWVTHEVIPSIRKTGKYEALPEVTDEHLKIAYTLINILDRPNLGKGAQKEIGKAIANAIKLSGRENKKQKYITALTSAVGTEPTPSDLLNELLSYAVPWLTFIPRSETELKSSILYDEKFYYIFPFATEKHMKHPEAKKRIYSEIKFLDGKNKNKKFKFWFNDKSKNYHIRILPREAVMLSPLPSPDMPSPAQPTGNSEK